MVILRIGGKIINRPVSNSTVTEEKKDRSAKDSFCSVLICSLEVVTQLF